MTPETLALITAYFVCSATAEERVLTQTEATTCATLYLETKLSFMPNFDLSTYRALSTKERANVNMQAYAAYLAWRAANPKLVADLEAEARAQVAESTS